VKLAEATNSNPIWRMLVACWIISATRAQAYSHAHAHWHPSTQARTHASTHTHWEICNSYCFSTATAVIVTLYYVACLSNPEACFFIQGTVFSKVVSFRKKVNLRWRRSSWRTSLHGDISWLLFCSSIAVSFSLNLRNDS
jgi:hypothetical protein